MRALRSAAPILLGGVSSWSMCPGGFSREPEGPQHVCTALGIPSPWCAAHDLCPFGLPDSLLGLLSGVPSPPSGSSKAVARHHRRPSLVTFLLRSPEEETLPGQLSEAGTRPQQEGRAQHSALREHRGKASSAWELAKGFVALCPSVRPWSGKPRPLCFSAPRVCSPSSVLALAVAETLGPPAGRRGHPQAFFAVQGTIPRVLQRLKPLASYVVSSLRLLMVEGESSVGYSQWRKVFVPFSLKTTSPPLSCLPGAAGVSPLVWTSFRSSRFWFLLAFLFVCSVLPLILFLRVPNLIYRGVGFVCLCVFFWIVVIITLPCSFHSCWT